MTWHPDEVFAAACVVWLVALAWAYRD